MLIDPKTMVASPVMLDAQEGWATISLSQLAEDTYIFRHFRNKTNGFYVDAGAFHPKKYSNTYLLRKYRGWSGINIDANPETIEKFEKWSPATANVHAALDEHPSEVEFVVYSGAAHSTMDEARKLKNEDLEVSRTLRMTTRTLSSIVDEHADGREIDFLSVDVEGRDLPVLRSFDWTGRRPSLVCVEDHDFLSSVNSGRKSDIFAFMQSVGYEWCSHFSVSSFYKPS